MDTALSEVLVFKLFRAESATGTVTTPPIVITLDIIEHRRSHQFPADKALSMDTFHLQRMEEAFRAGIVVTTPRWRDIAESAPCLRWKRFAEHRARKCRNRPQTTNR